MCVMGTEIAQPTVSQSIIVVQKCVYLMKISMSAVRHFEGSQLADFYVTMIYIFASILLLNDS